MIVRPSVKAARLAAAQEDRADQGRREAGCRRSRRGQGRHGQEVTASHETQSRKWRRRTARCPTHAFGHEFNEALVHQVVTPIATPAAPAPRRRRPRAEVRGGGRKPRAQKGTGQARAGSIRSPIWVGGGRAFAAKPRDFEQKVNRKMYRGAMRSMLSRAGAPGSPARHRRHRARGAEDEAAREPSSSRSARARADHRRGVRREAVPRRAQPAARRSAARWRALNPLSLVAHDKVLVTVGAREADRGAPAMSNARPRTMMTCAARAARDREDLAAPCRSSNQYMFRVRDDATKADIKARRRADVRRQGRSACRS